MRIIRCVWTFIVESLVLFVIVAIFRAAHSGFEVIVASGLTLVYFAIVWNAIMLGRAQAQSVLAIGGELVLVRRLLKDPTADTVEAELRDMTDRYKQAFVVIGIRGAFWSLDCVVALWHLLRAVS